MTVQPFEDFAATFVEMLLHRVLEGEPLLAVGAGVVGVGLVAGGYVAVQLVLSLGAVRTMRTAERTVAVTRNDVPFQLGRGPGIRVQG